LYYRSPNSHPT